MPRVTDPVERLRRALRRRVLRTLREFQVFEPGDKVMICLSGGKDSYVLFHLMHDLQRTAPFPMELVGVHLDQQQPGYDGAPLRAWLEDFGQPFEILSRDTYSIVTRLTPEGGTYCAPCSRLRRGTLYEAAERLGCNKIALGHHRDDALETLLMNLFFSGRVQAMPATYTTDDGRFDVVRPLIECAERDIAEYARLLAFPILPCTLCGSQSGLQRQAMGALLSRLEADIPKVREVMLGALKNVRAGHLLDADLMGRLGEGAVGDLEVSGCGEAAPVSGVAQPPLVVIDG